MNVSEKITINSPAENVWKTLSALDGVEKYLPVVKSSKIQGSGSGVQRTCQVQFGEQKGTLVEKIKVDDQNKTLQISIEKGPAPFEGVSINMQVKPIDDKTSEFSVWSEISDEQSQPIQQIFQMMTQGLKQLHEAKN
ncbi:MAG: putative polyketide cyclase [Nitrosopumilales archaeon]|nr:MAG: putative polyketide cyclase [Nitrosopumilales archaeon]